jgi:putative ABC transport system ATP-binding protein
MPSPQRAVSSRAILEATGVEKTYGKNTAAVHALAGVDVNVYQAEFLAVTGPSGSGKSTLLNCLSGLDVIDAGAVLIDGVDLASMNDADRTELRASSMGFVFQSSNLLDAFTALENVALPMILSGSSRPEARTAATDALERVGLRERINHFPNTLSGGEQQRVAIARALVKRPRIVWADEPTGNLDTANAEQVIALFRSLVGDGATLVLVTHDLDLAAQVDRRIEVRDGHIVSAHSA